jgi:hypothetical protein
MSEPTRMVKLATLWQRKSGKSGKTYFSGFMGDVQLLMFRGEEITRDSGETVQTWRLFAQERDPERRPQRKERPPAAEAERGTQTAEALDQRGAAWSKRQPLPRGGDPGQRDTGDPGRPFDDEIPF